MHDSASILAFEVTSTHHSDHMGLRTYFRERRRQKQDAAAAISQPIPEDLLTAFGTETVQNPADPDKTSNHTATSLPSVSKHWYTVRGKRKNKTLKSMMSHGTLSRKMLFADDSGSVTSLNNEECALTRCKLNYDARKQHEEFLRATLRQLGVPDELMNYTDQGLLRRDMAKGEIIKIQTTIPKSAAPRGRYFEKVKPLAPAISMLNQHTPSLETKHSTANSFVDENSRFCDEHPDWLFR